MALWPYCHNMALLPYIPYYHIATNRANMGVYGTSNINVAIKPFTVTKTKRQNNTSSSRSKKDNLYAVYDILKYHSQFQLNYKSHPTLVSRTSISLE